MTTILTWKALLRQERESTYFKAIAHSIKTKRDAGVIIYPSDQDMFSALDYTPFDKVKVVILGQDPYHRPGQAHGLAFSVNQGIPQPPSLKNIFKELQNDLNISPPEHGCLVKWAKQGVLLLNTVLTVEAGKPQSHSKIGWEQFTDQIIMSLSQKKRGLIFLLWGGSASKKANLIDQSRHTVLYAAHPSPLSCYRGFLGCKHFSRTNEILVEQGMIPISWQLD